jgi:ATP-dependent DNA helicase DinG
MQKVLTESVRLVTGIPDAEPRPGQAKLADIQTAIDTVGHVSGAAPTGLGKSLALLAPAFAAAASSGQRTVISTESLSLQAQIIDKDAPVVAQATENVYGKRPAFALLKGFSNYVCTSRASATAEIATKQEGRRRNTIELLAHLKSVPLEKATVVDGVEHPNSTLIPLLQWALSQKNPGQPGDRHSYEGSMGEGLWSTVSVTPKECIGTSCPFEDICRPKLARQAAGEADIVVTNHSMLAVQAANDTPVVIGNKTLGNFEIIMVDEAHALTASVRSQGAAELSSRRIGSAVKTLISVLDEGDKGTAQLVKEGNFLASAIQEELSLRTKGLAPGETGKLGQGDDPLGNIADVTTDWAKRCGKALKNMTDHPNPVISLKARRAAGRFDSVVADIKSVRDHRVGAARWVALEEPRYPGDTPLSLVAYTPVDVAPLMQRSLWTAETVTDEEDEEEIALAEAGEKPEPKPRTPLAVVCVSATLPSGFSFQAGLNATTADYPSPFDDAYGSSLLYIPKVTGAELGQLYPGWAPGRRARFDPKLHLEWALRKNVELVEANLGSGLILSANSTAGKAYTEALRRAAKGRWKVHSQWDGTATRQLINAWRDDETSVLVGTKSLMTGVDAKGATCNLVTIDRIPRAKSNPVDDARVEALMERLQMDKWAADRLVYPSDAALLLEQALGRLIRSMTDSGLAAVLDPRMLKSGPVSYPEPTRLVYKKAMARFPKITTSQSAAEEFLVRQSSQKAMRLAA